MVVFRQNVIAKDVATEGGVVSRTVTFAVQLDLLSEASFAVKTTSLMPIFEQLKEVLFKDILIMPQLSVARLLIESTFKSIFPVLSK